MTQSTEPVSEKTPKTILDSHAKAFFEMGCSYSAARILLENLMYDCRDIFAAHIRETEVKEETESLKLALETTQKHKDSLADELDSLRRELTQAKEDNDRLLSQAADDQEEIAALRLRLEKMEKALKIAYHENQNAHCFKISSAGLQGCMDRQTNVLREALAPTKKEKA